MQEPLYSARLQGCSHRLQHAELQHHPAAARSSCCDCCSLKPRLCSHPPPRPSAAPASARRPVSPAAPAVPAPVRWSRSEARCGARADPGAAAAPGSPAPSGPAGDLKVCDPHRAPQGRHLPGSADAKGTWHEWPLQKAECLLHCLQCPASKALTDCMASRVHAQQPQLTCQV